MNSQLSAVDLSALPCLYLALAKAHVREEVDPQHDAERAAEVSYAS